MSIFTISDLHLSFGTDKPMDVFGWENHVERLKSNWMRLVKPEDTVVLPGDFSWALKCDEALEDFKFIESLPGKKLLLKGNHDLWWTTAKKLKKFFEDNNIKSVDIIYNNSVVVGEYAVCGTRGWLLDGNSDDKKILLREAGRLERSLESAVSSGKKPLVFMHFPPAYASEHSPEIVDVLHRFSVDTVYYGHIHGLGFNNSVSEFDGIKLKLVSSDCLEFVPFLIK